MDVLVVSLLIPCTSSPTLFVRALASLGGKEVDATGGGEGMAAAPPDELDASDAERVFCLFAAGCRSVEAFLASCGGTTGGVVLSYRDRRRRSCSFSTFRASRSSE